MRPYKVTIFLIALLFAADAGALPTMKKKNTPESPTVIKADHVNADEVEHLLILTGNVEANKGESTVYADEMTYRQGEMKGAGVIRAIGNVKIKNLEVGNVRATSAELRDDFGNGKFYNSKIYFSDGSYLTSPEMERKSKLITVLRKSVFSLCPNEEIAENNDLAGKKKDMLTIKSSKTTIDREANNFKVNNGIIRIYDMPVLYVPYLKSALPSKKRESGFLFPSYSKSTNLGTRLVLPYYFNLAPNADLTATPYIGIGGSQILVNNELRHKTTYGEYNAIFEIGNNKIKNRNDLTIVERTRKKYRWNLTGKGVFDFTRNVGMDFEVNEVSDNAFLRDYHFYYLNFALSKVNMDYINGRNYHSAKIVRIQELEYFNQSDMAPLAAPVLNSHIETQPSFFKGKAALTSNATVITRSNGLQYRRISTVPEVNLPFNLNGNLFTFNSKLQGDFYQLENNYKNDTSYTARFNSAQYNYRPEVSFSWRLPLMKGGKKNSFLLEPIVNIVSSSYGRNFNRIPNGDSNSSELTVSNLFVNDRISGFDRNESGTRATYGLKSSWFNKYGEFSVTTGQSYRTSTKEQDAVIRGFNGGQKSNIVGQVMYKAKKHFSIIYSFQLDESTYHDKVNEVTSKLDFDRFTLMSNYLLIRRTPRNPVEMEQMYFSGTAKLGTKWDATFNGVKDMVSGRFIQRSVLFNRNGCCTIFSFNISESNPSNLVKPQRSFSFSLTFKNL